MNFKKLFIFIGLLGTLSACESIDENERFIGPVEFTPKKNVLIEDFTGQRCVNCPKAADAVHSLQQTYGANHIISVAIHGGSMSLPNTSPAGLATPAGEAYNERWAVDSWPKGMVDRKGGLLEYTSWSAYAVNCLQQTAAVDLNMNGNLYDAATKSLTVNVEMAAEANISGMLQVWLVESGIVAYQSMPDGSHNREYVHNHVLRDVVNGTWGEEVGIMKGEPLVKSYTYEITNENWNPENMAVVAFVYNDAEGVLQVIETPVIQ